MLTFILYRLLHQLRRLLKQIMGSTNSRSGKVGLTDVSMLVLCCIALQLLDFFLECETCAARAIMLSESLLESLMLRCQNPRGRAVSVVSTAARGCAKQYTVVIGSLATLLSCWELVQYGEGCVNFLLCSSSTWELALLDVLY